MAISSKGCDKAEAGDVNQECSTEEANFEKFLRT